MSKNSYQPSNANPRTNSLSSSRLRELLKLLFPLGIASLAYGITAELPNIYPQNYEQTIYPNFLLASALIWLILIVISIFSSTIRKKLAYLAPWIAFAFFFLEVMDVLTLKTGLLLLPFAPSPDKIMQVFPNNFSTLIENLVASISLLTKGVVIGLIAGLATGLLMGWSQIVNYWFTPLLKIIGPVPSAAWLPIAVVLMPTTQLAGIFLIAVAIWFPLSLLLSSAIKNTDKRKIEAARVMGASETYILFHVALPSALPAIFNALFMGLSSSFGALIISEQLGVEAGLGWYINWASSWGEYSKVFASVGILIVIFYLIISMLFLVRDHLMKWQSSLIRW